MATSKRFSILCCKIITFTTMIVDELEISNDTVWKTVIEDLKNWKIAYASYCMY
jgi:hypothetical protein